MRLIEVTLAALALATLLPLMFLVALMVLLFLGRPVFFSQERAGLMGAPFRLYKFRSMRPEATPGECDADRLTAFGRWLRSTSIDELPSLWNVIRGDIALVGPRPLPTSYLALYDERQSMRHLVRPGITGWAQVNGRNSVSWNEKLEMDVWYVEHRGLALDLRILWLTIFKVLRRDGISAEGHATMEHFTGASSDD